jgi:hypothetical protein
MPTKAFSERRRCGAPGCQRRIFVFYFACAQHRALLGFELNCLVQTAWQERRWRPDHFESMKARAFRVWGWQPETLMIKKQGKPAEAPAQNQPYNQDGDVARRAIKWMMEHWAYYDPRSKTMMQVSSLQRTPITARPAEDIALLLFEVSREVELEAEHAS